MGHNIELFSEYFLKKLDAHLEERKAYLEEISEHLNDPLEAAIFLKKVLEYEFGEDDTSDLEKLKHFSEALEMVLEKHGGYKCLKDFLAIKVVE